LPLAPTGRLSADLIGVPTVDKIEPQDRGCQLRFGLKHLERENC
jgi:hypothetical protein